MGNILIAVATMVIGFILTTYGAYAGYHSVSRSKTVSHVQSSFERQLIYIDMARQDLGRMPSASDLVMNRITSANRDGLTFSYQLAGSTGVLCVVNPATDYVIEGLQQVAALRPGAMFGSTCNTNGGPSATSVSVTIRIN